MALRPPGSRATPQGGGTPSSCPQGPNCSVCKARLPAAGRGVLSVRVPVSGRTCGSRSHFCTLPRSSPKCSDCTTAHSTRCCCTDARPRPVFTVTNNGVLNVPCVPPGSPLTACSRHSGATEGMATVTAVDTQGQFPQTRVPIYNPPVRGGIIYLTSRCQAMNMKYF